MAGEGIERRAVQGRIRVRRLAGQASRCVSWPRKTIEKITCLALKVGRVREYTPRWMLETGCDERAIYIYIYISVKRNTPDPKHCGHEVLKLFSARAPGCVAP